MSPLLGGWQIKIVLPCQSICQDLESVALHFDRLLTKNGCEVSSVMGEWDRLKQEMLPLVKYQPLVKYTAQWARLWRDPKVQRECRNVLHVIEILLITPFTNAKVERLFR